MPSPSPTRAELAKQLLLYKMKEYSNDFYCASWLVDLEFELWHKAEIPNPTKEENYFVLLSQECRQLGEIADGWWVYSDETCPDENGPVFIPMTRWLQILKQK